MTREIRTTAQRLAKAVELGAKLGALDRDPSLHSLSRKSWDRLCRQMAGCPDAAAFAALVERCRELPALWNEIGTRARLWADRQQDRPAPWSGFGSHGDAAAYAERVGSQPQITIEQASAVAAWLAAEQRDPASFGRLGWFDELDRLLGTPQDELAQLDAELAGTVHLADVEWDGSAPLLRHDRFVVPIGPGSVARIASAFAELARREPPAEQDQAA